MGWKLAQLLLSGLVRSLGLLKPQFTYLGNGYYSNALTRGDLREISETPCTEQRAQLLKYSEPSGSATAALTVVYKDHGSSKTGTRPSRSKAVLIPTRHTPMNTSSITSPGFWRFPSSFFPLS